MIDTERIFHAEAAKDAQHAEQASNEDVKAVWNTGAWQATPAGAQQPADFSIPADFSMIGY